ncbi:MAG: AmmeMemoRadiSam system protein B [Phycisphaerales bacterium]|nr:MAG: AmmeMemoRadiSam system protein B [Phycisphaerales bacterium]
MHTRNPVVAGQFYPGDRASCVADLQECLAERSLPESLPAEIVAGIVPHAGWIFSGALAGMVFSAVRQRHEQVDTFVLFGAAHRYYGGAPALFDSGLWRTPLGEVAIDDELAGAILATRTAVADLRAHGLEHSIEVQVPFVQHLFGGAAIVPILVPPGEEAVLLGEAVGKLLQKADKKVVCIGSTDLTHYGPGYGFAPMGTGPDALRWADTVNDQGFIDSALRLSGESILAGAVESYNACGAGAAAAAVEAAHTLGKTKGLLLAHTSSGEVMKSKMGRTSTESVGYAAIVF